MIIKFHKKLESVKKLSDLSKVIKFGLRFDIEAIHGALNQLLQFHLVVQNLDVKPLLQVRVELTGPPEISILRKSIEYGKLPSKKKKIKVFKIMPIGEGIFTLNANLFSENMYVMSLPIEVRVGALQEVRPLQVTRSFTKNLVSQTNCPFCHAKIESEAKFCPNCGSNLVEKELVFKEESTAKTCRNCGAEVPIEAKFCVKCAQKID